MHVNLLWLSGLGLKQDGEYEKIVHMDGNQKSYKGREYFGIALQHLGNMLVPSLVA